jgi:hypothetical protein
MNIYMSTFIDSNGIYYLLDSSNNTASVVNNVLYGSLTTANILSSFTIISKNHCIFYKGSMLKASDFIDKYENVKR